MKISKAVWEYYINKLAQINRTAADHMEDYVQAHGLSDADALVDYGYALSTRYGEASAELACQMYDTMAAMQNASVPAAEPAATATYDETASAVLGAREKAPSTVSGVIGRLVKQAGADTTLKNARRDNAEFAWIPSGDACAFCETLASNGWQHATAETASGDHADHIHNNCKCEFAIRFDGKSTVEGYDPDALYDKYINAEGDTWEEKVNSMRRDNYAKNKKKIRAQQRAAYARRKSGNMTSKEYNAYLKDLARAKQLEQITLPKDEYALVMSELNTNMSSEDRKRAIVQKAIGDNVYTIVNRGFNNYTVVGKEPIHD